MEWRPIETAPRDGTRIDIWGTNPDGSGCRVANVCWGPVADWMGRERADWQHYHVDAFTPTHWMPLPSPPETP